MVQESLKLNKIRNKEFFDDYFQGDILDIGGGTTPVIPSAQVFSLQRGDAQHILKYLESESLSPSWDRLFNKANEVGKSDSCI